MGATNQIKETNLSLQLAGLICPQCQQKFTPEEIEERNWECWFDTSNDVKLMALANIPLTKTRHLYFPVKRTGYEFAIWIRSIEHETCPDTELCQSCYGRFLTELMKEVNDEYYCKACRKEVGHV